MDTQNEAVTLLDVLALLSAGSVTVSVGGYPFLSARADERELQVEASGAKRAGLSLSKVINLQEGRRGALSGSEKIARKLSSLGWKLTIYDKGESLLTMGSGVSRLTGRIRANPLRLKRLMDALG